MEGVERAHERAGLGLAGGERMSELRLLLDGDPGLSLPATFSASSSIDESFLLMASRIMLIVFSRLRRLVDGDVRVVPSDDCRRWWWRLNGEPSAPGEPGTGDDGELGEPMARSFSLVGVSTRPGESLAMRSGDSATPTSGEVGAVEPPAGDASPAPNTSSAPSSPDEAAAATAAKSSGSMRSGGRRSLSMSDLRASV